MTRAPELQILLVDDDAGHLELVRRKLRRHGIQSPIETASSGAEALEQVACWMAEAAPDAALLLLLDINMPGGMDGVEVLRRMKAGATTREIPVIMLSTTDDPREIERCHALGCSGYVTKPVDPAAFVAMVQRLGLSIEVASSAEPARR